MPKEQEHAARSEVDGHGQDRHGQAQEAGRCQARDGEREEGRFGAKGDRRRRVAEEQQDERRRNDAGGYLADGKAGFILTDDKAARFHAGDEDRNHPDGRHPQGRNHEPDRRQAQDPHEPARQVCEPAEDHRHGQAEGGLKKFADSPAGRNQRDMGAL
jgi:hypothetical protein